MEDEVLTGEQAVKFLSDTARQHIDLIMAGEEDAEGIQEIVEDLRDMKDEIVRKGWAWVLIREHPMSASGIVVNEMIER